MPAINLVSQLQIHPEGVQLLFSGSSTISKQGGYEDIQWLSAAVAIPECMVLLDDLTDLAQAGDHL